MYGCLIAVTVGASVLVGADLVMAHRCVDCCPCCCRDAWHALQASRDPAVLCEVVNCLPQLMAALGPVLTHREMCPALAGLLQSHLTWVGGQMVQVMADLLTHLPPTGHELLLKVGGTHTTLWHATACLSCSV